MLQRIQRQQQQQQQPAEAGAGTEQKQTRRQIQFAFCCTVAAKKMFTRRAKVSSEVGVGFFVRFTAISCGLAYRIKLGQVFKLFS